MLTRTEKATGDTTTYTYNAENQLIRGDFPGGGHVVYRYDGLGRRIEKNVNGVLTQYIYDNEDILLETDSQGNILARYTHGPGIDEPLIMKREGQSYCYHTDGSGSITFITDSSGDIINAYQYEAFGSITEPTTAYGGIILPPTPVENPYTYTGREYDSETGLYHYRLRDYDPRIGRFIQEDPIGLLDGLHLYTYCDNDPINWIDPWGLFTVKYPIPGIGIPGNIYAGGGVTLPGSWVPIDIPIPGDLTPPIHLPDPGSTIKVKKEQKKEGITEVINNWAKGKSRKKQEREKKTRIKTIREHWRKYREANNPYYKELMRK